MQSNYRNTNKYTSHFKRPVMWAAFTILLIFSTLVFSKTAHAGLISFINSILGGGQVSAKVKQTSISLNSQTMNILQAHTNINPTADMVADATPVDGGETLVPDLAFSSATSTDTTNTQISTYVIRPGDTISSVAKMFKVSINTILWANDLNGRSTLQTGQTLIILPISGISYAVQRGDTMTSIARKYKADVSDVLAYNDITMSTPLTPGMTLVIPYAEIAVPSAASNRSRGRIKNAPYEPLIDNVSLLPSYPGYYANPLPGGVETQGLHGHNAVDLAAPVGTPIRAAAAGTVIISKVNGGWNGGYGNYVVISHPNGTQTLYAHMSRSSVSAGESVSQGEAIGYIGMTGLTTGPHVHFEIRGARNPF